MLWNHFNSFKKYKSNTNNTLKLVKRGKKKTTFLSKFKKAPLNSRIVTSRNTNMSYNFSKILPKLANLNEFKINFNKMYLTFVKLWLGMLTKKMFWNTSSYTKFNFILNSREIHVNLTNNSNNRVYLQSRYNWIFKKELFVKNLFKRNFEVVNKLKVYHTDNYTVDFKNYYLESYLSLLIHNYLLNYKNKNKIFSLYTTTDKHHFLKSSSFSSSLHNFIKFKKFIFKSTSPRQSVLSLFFLKLETFIKNKSKIFSRKRIFFKSLYKNRFWVYVLKLNIKMGSLKFFIKRHLVKLFLKKNRVINKKLRYLKFLIRTKVFNKNFNSNVKLRIKKVSNFNFCYKINQLNSKNISISYFNNRFNTVKYRPIPITFSKRINLFWGLHLNKIFSLLLFFKNSFFLKAVNSINLFSTEIYNNSFSTSTNFLTKIKQIYYPNLSFNIIPTKEFNLKINKLIVSNNYNIFFKENITPWVYSNLIRFIEFCSSKKVLLQIYSFMNQSIDLEYVTLYKRWITRLSYYERRLGHRFFLEEALHILHIGFTLKDVKLISNWLKAIIKRISFWKTRFIFRFIKYLFNNYFIFILRFLGIKGFKVKLKGKISVAGNSRKRSILYRVGQTSHSTTSIKVIHDLTLITTFTGVMGLQTWIFY